MLEVKKRRVQLVAITLDTSEGSGKVLRGRTTTQTIVEVETVSVGGVENIPVGALLEYTKSPELHEAAGLAKRKIVGIEEGLILAEKRATATTVDSALSETKNYSTYRAGAGRRAYQTVPTAAVGPSKFSGGAERGAVILKRHDNSLGVNEKAVSDPRARAERLRLQ